MADSIMTSKSPLTSSHSRSICLVCQKQFSQYTCPRCNMRYCSVQCYKSHSLHCTESFMRDNVMEELRQLQPQDESKQKMLDILKRFHAEEENEMMEKNGSDSDSDSNSFLSQETVQKIFSGGQVNLDDLSLEEQKEFHGLVASGKLNRLIKPWDPWWRRPSAKHLSLGQEGAQLVQPLGSNNEELESEPNDREDDQGSAIPLGPAAPLPSVRKLSAAEPSPFLAFHLVDILYSYCFTLRLYNGDWSADALGAAIALSSISFILGEGGQPETVMEALCHCLEQTCSPGYRHVGGAQFGLLLMDDVASILDLGGAAIICLLCDLQRLIEAAEIMLKSDRSMKSRVKELTAKLKSTKRKVYFLMCWVNEQSKESWSSLAFVVKAEKSSAMEYADGKRGPMEGEKTIRAEGKPLIREVK